MDGRDATIEPGYVKTEIGIIPGHWQLQGLLKVLSIANGQVDPRNEPYKSMPLVAPDHIESGTGRLLEKRTAFEQKAVSGKYAFASGQIVYSKIRPYLRKATLVDFDGLCSADMYPLRPAEGVSAGFMLAVLLSHRFSNYAESVSMRSGMPKINRTEMADFVVALPSSAEQRAIAEVLSDVDALLAGLDRLIAKKRDLKQAAMQQLLSGKVRLPGFREQWAKRPLGEMGRCLRGVTYQGNIDLFAHDTSDTKRLLRSNNVQEATVQTTEVQFVSSARVTPDQVLRRDDILICMANGSRALVGKAGLFQVSDGYDYTFGAFMGCFRVHSLEANPKFLFFLFQTDRYREYINNLLAGSAINNLSPSAIESLEFLMPAPHEQTAIETVLSDIDAEIAALEVRRKKTLALKQAMMQDLLTGRIRLV